ncbi:phosphatidate cytidylyltransferase [Ponticaulis sp.]|uniref:phosphatidate cytidylyltransferase n=1 Tax=Ponticaulis sp. TaxID=2020902 RepID=UPI0025EBE51C|nr:phosphatidate cytidylyltransferase [Ponticaulis sp.]|tara:strand:- start:89056 stop:89892 length:837 start_codon:yes stop_codon:yes gene_type:complete
MAAALKSPNPDGLMLRLISALVLIPAGLFVVWAGGYVLLIAGLACAALMWSEFWTVTTKDPRSPMFLCVGGILLCALGLAATGLVSVLVALIALVSLTTGLMVVLKTPKRAWLLLGVCVIFGAVMGLIELRGVSMTGLFMTIVVMTSVWATDISAYFAGRGFGGPQLAPRGSPNKTWSGAAGAVICTALIGALASGILEGSLMNWVFFTAGVSVIGQLGDLAESLWKRQFNVKDSGALIPGHGGILDRLDSFSAVLLVLAILFSIFPDFPDTFLGLGE